MSAPSSSLPTPRQLLTSILNAIAEIPLSPPPPPETSTTRTDALGGGGRGRGRGGGAETRSIQLSTSDKNPLKRIDPSHRPLFTTLHVLFPSLLLPALDLLDRGLVTRLIHHKPSGHDGDDVEMTEERGGDSSSNSSSSRSTSASPSTVYLVRSAQKHPTGGGRRNDVAAGGGGQTIYIVHTAVWNCTCAAFAFAAFPPPAAAPPLLSTLRRKRTEQGEEGSEDEEEQEEVEVKAAGGFGGMSFDGRRVGSCDGDHSEGGGVPPCCKHLLACVLVERWAVLGGYLNKRSVGREELAGIFAGI